VARTTTLARTNTLVRTTTLVRIIAVAIAVTGAGDSSITQFGCAAKARVATLERRRFRSAPAGITVAWSCPPRLPQRS
jgi:hypothetical protein